MRILGRVCHAGNVPHGQVARVLSEHDFFLLPTLSESFGHVILEALAAGCPVFISDTTPWDSVGDSHAGWAIPLSDTAAWIRALQHGVDMNAAQYQAMSNAARRFAEAECKLAETIDQYRRMSDLVAGQPFITTRVADQAVGQTD